MSGYLGRCPLRRRFLQVLTIAFTSQFLQAQQLVFEDDFENGNTNGWILSGPDDMAVEGAWEFGDPIGTTVGVEQAQPESGFLGQRCAFTAQNPAGLASQHDVDGGVVYLVSPVIDVSSFTSVRLDYVRWYYLNELNADDDDFFVVQVRESTASAWVDVEWLDDSARANAWTPASILLDGFIQPTATMQIRFGASDGVLALLGNILEAAVDQVQVFGLQTCQNNEDCGATEFCSLTGQCLPFGNGDPDGDGDIDLEDYYTCLNCIGGSGGICSDCNVAGDELVLPEDLVACAQLMSGPE
ncbi:MAG: hypothetical protein GXP29_08825 [Planctomycetes bacterium]|nr:hypothetical protein [Planctomycetota bacterium]